METQGSRRPKSVTEYFAWLYCKRKKLLGVTGPKMRRQALKIWKTLTPAEQDVFINKYNKWQAENDDRVASILQCAEPFMKKKYTRKTDFETHTIDIINTSDDNQMEQMLDASQLKIPTDDNSSNVETDHENQDHESRISVTNGNGDNLIQQVMDSPQMTPSYDDNLSNATSEITNRVYAASVIDTDIDETASQPEMSATVQCDILTEPIRPAVKNARELFETLKCSGTRPELATMEWKNMSQQDKKSFFSAITTMRRQYLIKYEEYLESLSSPELFKHYIKTLNRYCDFSF